MKENCIPYTIVLPSSKKTGILLSIPHCGTDFPTSIRQQFKSELIEHPGDTDSFLEKLYDFATQMGITIIYSNYSRWVIDLNRSPKNHSLYNDGRIITSLCPTTNFLGENIYNDKKFEPGKNEIKRRLSDYYIPYHNKIDEILKELKKEFKTIVLWDAHSIRRNVKTIQSNPFPDLILGNNFQKTASKKIISTVLNVLQKSEYEVHHNSPFKGGYITRSKGNPTNYIHALQLEMCKDLYMSENETKFDTNKAEKIRKTLKNTLSTLLNFTDERI